MCLLDTLGLVIYFSLYFAESTLSFPYISLLNIALFLDHSMTEPHSLPVPLHIVLLYFLIFLPWHNITHTLPYDFVFALLQFYYKYLFTTLQYTSF